MEETDEIRQAYKRTFDGPMGGTVLADLMEYCGFLASHDGNPFEEGRRDVFLHLLEMYRDPSVVDFARVVQTIPDRNEECKQYEADT